MRTYAAVQLQNNEYLRKMIKKHIFLKVNKKYIINKFS